jgi:hypothetical protein
MSVGASQCIKPQGLRASSHPSSSEVCPELASPSYAPGYQWCPSYTGLGDRRGAQSHRTSFTLVLHCPVSVYIDPEHKAQASKPRREHSSSAAAGSAASAGCRDRAPSAPPCDALFLTPSPDPTDHSRFQVHLCYHHAFKAPITRSFQGENPSVMRGTTRGWAAAEAPPDLQFGSLR